MAHAHCDIWGCILAVEGKRMSDGAQRVIVTGDGLQLMLRPEEAATLASLLGQERQDVPRALAAYEAQRLARATRVQNEARKNRRIYHAGGLVGFGRDQVMRHLGPEGMTRRYDWLYGFRVAD